MQEPQHVFESHEVTSQGIEGLNIHFILAIIARLFVSLNKSYGVFSWVDLLDELQDQVGSIDMANGESFLTMMIF